MTVNEAENKLRSRACATGVANWMWNYDVEDGTITLSLTAGKKHASRSAPSDKIFLDEHGRAIPGGDGSHQCVRLRAVLRDDGRQNPQRKESGDRKPVPG